MFLFLLLLLIITMSLSLRQVNHDRTGTTGALRPQIHSTIPLEMVAGAHAKLESRAVQGRIVLQISDDTWA